MSFKATTRITTTNLQSETSILFQDMKTGDDIRPVIPVRTIGGKSRFELIDLKVGEKTRRDPYHLWYLLSWLLCI